MGENGQSQLLDELPKPTVGREVFVFPGYDGSFEINGAKKTISGMLRILTHCLGNTAQNPAVRVCAVGYKHLEFNRDASSGTFVSADAKQFVDRVLVPRLFPNEQRPSVVQLQERLSRITFVGHSYGTIFAQYVANALREELQGRGYNAADVADIVESGLLITTGGVTELDVGTPQFSAIHARASNDSFIKMAASHRTDAHYPNTPNDDPEKKQAHKQQLEQMGMSGSREFSMAYGKNYAVMNGDVPSHIVMTEHGERQVYDAERIQRENPRMDFHHTPAPYWYRSEEPVPGDVDNRMMSGLLQNALGNAVTRKRGIPNLESLLTDGLLAKGFSRSDIAMASADQGRKIA